MSEFSIDENNHRRDFKHALNRDRLGKQHGSLNEFLQAASKPENVVETKEYTLIVLTSEPRRILLGKKHRGFDHGMYNSFGGKVESGESIDAGASRELYEETGIQVHQQGDAAATFMKGCRAGTLRFTFADSTKEMVVHLYHVRVSFRDESKRETRHSGEAFILPSKSTIRGCEEITPAWFGDWTDNPLDNMFADDSIWLPILLSGSYSYMEGRFHFAAGGQETNTITDFYLDLKPNTLEYRLFNALHERRVNSPTVKEFKEAYAFFNVIRGVYKKTKFDVVIDVAGGHGALGALFVISAAAKEAVVVDPARVGSVRLAWEKYIHDNKAFRFRHECLRIGLPAELRNALRKTSGDRVLVVACHACQHLSDEVCRLSTDSMVHVAVMPCCQKDLSKGSHWKATARRLHLSIEVTMDMLLAGRYTKPGYDVRMKFIDETITPQNRVVICKLDPSSRQTPDQSIHSRLQRAYAKAHPPTEQRTSSYRKTQRCLVYAAVFGSALALLLIKLK